VYRSKRFLRCTEANGSSGAQKLTVPQVHTNSVHFMEHESSLPHSQQPATCSYLHKHPSNPRQLTSVLTYILIVSPHLRERLPSELSPGPLPPHPQQPHLSISAVSRPTGTSIYFCKPTVNSVPLQATSLSRSSIPYGILDAVSHKHFLNVFL
jgi:hypothetical protein